MSLTIHNPTEMHALIYSAADGLGIFVLPNPADEVVLPGGLERLIHHEDMTTGELRPVAVVMQDDSLHDAALQDAVKWLAARDIEIAIGSESNEGSFDMLRAGTLPDGRPAVLAYDQQFWELTRNMRAASMKVLAHVVGLPLMDQEAFDLIDAVEAQRYYWD